MAGCGNQCLPMCGDPGCHDKCYDQKVYNTYKKDQKKYKSLSPPDAYYQNKDAIVVIHGQTDFNSFETLLVEDIPVTVAINVAADGTDAAIVTVTVTSTASFIAAPGSDYQAFPDPLEVTVVINLTTTVNLTVPITATLTPVSGGVDITLAGSLIQEITGLTDPATDSDTTYDAEVDVVLVYTSAAVSQFLSLGSGFFIKKHYIVTAAHVVMYNDATGPRVPAAPQAGFNRMEKIFVSVFNVNGCGKNYIYEADLIGVDGAGDVAVLKISEKKLWNVGLPCINKCHPYLHFGRSRDYCIGRKAYIIGNPFGQDYLSLTSGIVRDNRYFDHGSDFSDGNPSIELVRVDTQAIAGESGSPIMDEYGCVIGIFSLTVADEPSNTIIEGPSQYFFEPVVKVLIDGPRGCQGGHIEQINDVVGLYYRYIKGFLGFAWRSYGIQEFLGTPTPKFKKIVGIDR